MARFLFVVPPLTGHTNPTVPVAQALQARRHECAWAGHETAVGRLLPGGARLIALPENLPDEVVEHMVETAKRVRGLKGLKFLWEDFLIPLARAMREGVEEAVDEFEPDVVVVDQQALAGALVARSRGLKWATSATTSADLVESLGALPKVLEWVDAQLTALQREAGLDPVVRPENSPNLTVVFSTGALVGDTERFPDTYRFVGPAFRGRGPKVDFPWDDLSEGPKVLVSLGTLNAERGGDFFERVVEALGSHALDGRDLQVILVAPDDAAQRWPDNFIVRPWVPQVELLARVDAVVSHGGHNTVCEALAHGRPLVVTPVKDDQPVVAQQVVDAGCGVRLRFGRFRPEALREAVSEVLDDPAYAAAARLVGESFNEAGGAERAADLLEGLLP